MQYSEVEVIITHFVKLKNAHATFYKLANNSEYDELREASNTTNQALRSVLLKEVESVLAIFTKRTHEQYDNNSSKTEEEFWLQSHNQFILQEVDKCIMEEDFHFARVDFLIQLIFTKPPIELYQVYLKLLPKLIKAYQVPLKGYHSLKLIFLLEQLVDFIFTRNNIDSRLIPHLHAIAKLEIKTDSPSDLTFHHVFKSLSALHSIDQTETIEIIAQFTQHPNWNVRNLAQQILDNHTGLL